MNIEFDLKKHLQFILSKKIYEKLDNIVIIVVF